MELSLEKRLLQDKKILYFEGFFYFTKFDSENFFMRLAVFFLFPIAKPRNQAFVENLPQNWKWQNLDR